MSGKVFYSALMTETNSFSNIPTSYQSFVEGGMQRGNGTVYDEQGNVRFSMQPLLERVQGEGMELVAGLFADAAPGAPVQHGDYLRLREELLHALRQQLPVQAVFLSLHGAMMSTACDDCEGDLLREVRALVGPEVPIGAVLDPHAHLTDKMVEYADIMAFMKEYPHIDGLERSAEVLDILFAMLKGDLCPCAVVFDCQTTGFFPTQDQPMRGFVDSLFEREQQPGVLSISLVHGFPWGDTPQAGTKVLVYTDDDVMLGQAVAEEVGRDLARILPETGLKTITVERTIEQLCSYSNHPNGSDPQNVKPSVLADIADNPGGGAPSDSTFLLQAILDAGIRDVAIGLVFDPEAVKACHQVGVGGRLTLRIGGKISQFSGTPVDLDVEVLGVSCDSQMNVLDLVEMPMGDTAWVRGRGVDIVMGSVRTQMYAPDGFAHIGLDPSSRRALIVKSTNHFQAAFAPIAGEIHYVNTPGAINYNLKQIPYQKYQR
jgi:microcystin degradation protein MlrC